MKRIVSLIIAALTLALSLPFGASAFALVEDNGEGGEQRANPTYTPSSYYSSSVYYNNLREVRLTGNQRLDIVNIALSQVGYHEGNSIGQLDGSNSSGSLNYTEYGYWYGFCVLGNGAGFFYEWCAMFTAWAARQAQIPTTIINNASYAHAGTNPYYFRVTYYPRGYYTPKPGDLIFYDWAYNDRNWDHVGIVTHVENGRVHSVEGNASEAVIMRDVSLYDTEIQGYGAPAYTNALASALDVGSYTAPTKNLSVGDSGDDVRWVQAALLHLGYPCPIDGYYGYNTQRQIKRFQSFKGISATGTCGPQTRSALKSALANGFVSSEDPSTYPVPARTLKVGCTGNDVKWLQAVLKKLGAVITVDGDFGEGTKSRVIWAQAKYGLTQDGIVGPATRAKLLAAIGSGSGSSSGSGSGSSTDPSGYPVPTRTLKIGDSGNDVKWVQSILNKNGYSMNVTGYFGEKTKSHIIAVQKRFGLVQDGIVGPATRAKLASMQNGSPAPSSSYPEPTRNLRIGCTGSDVKWLQAALKRYGYTISVDGIFGPNTEALLKSFQRGNGLTPDGICGPATRKKIKERT